MGGLWDSCAEPVKDTAGKVIDHVLTVQCVPILINQIINVGLIFAGTVSVLFIIRAGYQYIMSNGDAKQAGAARQTLTYAIIGLILIFSSFFLLNFISTLTNTPCIKKIGFSACN
jgi:phosphate starvation-inducible membrane PsiE